MPSIRARKDNGLLFFDFRHQGARCREQTLLPDTALNRKKLQRVLERIDAEITLGTFEYRKYFPNSKRAAQFDTKVPVDSRTDAGIPLFRDFVGTWLLETEISWRHSTRAGNKGIINKYLLPEFGEKPVSGIRKEDVLAFRASIARLPGRNGNASLSPKTINLVVGMLTTIISEAADRYHFNNPTHNIKRLKNPRKEIQPFSLDEVRQILATVRSDFRNYLIVRFFTGMRTGEINGLRWSRVDWESRQILVRETVQQGRVEYTKTDGSQREIEMSSLVEDALRRQFDVTGTEDYVFSTRDGTPLDANNFTRRVWYPLLSYLGLPRRRPYQCRHTAATLWLASGENPEWIARQMGHTTTEMLFRVYSRYVPNLTRRDGSAFDNFVSNAMNGGMAPNREVQTVQDHEPAEVHMLREAKP